MILRIRGSAEIVAEVTLRDDDTMEIHDVFCGDVRFDVPSDGYVEAVGEDEHQIERDEADRIGLGLGTIKDHDVNIDFRMFVATRDPRRKEAAHV